MSSCPPWWARTTPLLLHPKCTLLVYKMGKCFSVVGKGIDCYNKPVVLGNWHVCLDKFLQRYTLVEPMLLKKKNKEI